MALTIHNLTHFTALSRGHSVSLGSNVYNESDALKKPFSGCGNMIQLLNHDDQPVFLDGSLEFTEWHTANVDKRYNNIIHSHVEGDVFPFVNDVFGTTSHSSWDEGDLILLTNRFYSTKVRRTATCRSTSDRNYHVRILGLYAWYVDPFGKLAHCFIHTWYNTTSSFPKYYRNLVSIDVSPNAPTYWDGYPFPYQEKSYYFYPNCRYENEEEFFSYFEENLDMQMLFAVRYYENYNFTRASQRCPYYSVTCRPVSSVPTNDDVIGAITTPPPHESWGTLAGEAYASAEDIGFSSNGVAYAKDLLDLSTQARRTLQSVKSLFGKCKGKMAAISSLFLSFYYGWRLTVADSKELLALSAEYSRHPVKRSGRRFYSDARQSYTQIYTVYFYPHQQLTDDLSLFMKYFDLDLDLGNIWDMIPFSFVIDWFVGIGDVAEAAAGYMDMNYSHKVIASSRTEIMRKQLYPRQLGLPSFSVGSVYLKYYSRIYSPYAEEPNFLPHVNPNFTHWVEAGALVLSRK